MPRSHTPPSPPSLSLEQYSAFGSQLSQQSLDSALRQVWKHLPQFAQRRALLPLPGQVLQEKRLVRLVVKTLLPCVGSLGAQCGVQPLGKDVPGRLSPTKDFDGSHRRKSGEALP